MTLALPAAGTSARFKFTVLNATLYALSFGDRPFP
jgi:hypothetical protein